MKRSILITGIGLILTVGLGSLYAGETVPRVRGRTSPFQPGFRLGNYSANIPRFPLPAGALERKKRVEESMD